MLVLTRKLKQSIMIGDDVEITVVEVKGDQVKLGIVAPVRVAVHRREVYEQIVRENMAAAASALGGGLSALATALEQETDVRKSNREQQAVSGR